MNSNTRSGYPRDYRSFIRDVGDGGAGPYCGILPLMADRVRDREDAEELPLLVQPFPHEASWNEAVPLHPEPAGSQDAFLTRLHEFEDRYFAPDHTAGSIAIYHYGCGDWIRLVITGGQRGSLWQDGRPGDYGIWPLNTSFSPWYTAWLSTGDSPP